MSAFQISYVLLWILVVVLLVAVLALYSAAGARIGKPASGAARAPRGGPGGPEIGDTVAPPLLPAMEEAPLDEDARRWFFVTTTCASCETLRSTLRTLPDNAIAGPVVVFCHADAGVANEWSRGLPPWVRVVPDEHGDAFKRFNIMVTPFFVGCDDAGRCVIKGSGADSTSVIEYEEELLKQGRSVVSGTETVLVGSADTTGGHSRNGGRS